MTQRKLTECPEGPEAGYLYVGTEAEQAEMDRRLPGLTRWARHYSEQAEHVPFWVHGGRPTR